MTSAPSEPFAKLYDLLMERREDNGLGDVARARAAMEATALAPADDDVAEPTTYAGCPAEWITVPESQLDHIVLYVHGGGFVMGSLNTHRKLAGDIARAAHARVLLVDYPLAPESPFPVAIGSITETMRSLRDVVPDARITIAGDSAGGNLVLASMLSMHAEHIELPSAAACISPWSDLARTDERSIEQARLDPIVTPTDLSEMRHLYLGEHDPTSPMATPHLGDLSVLPPLLVQVGGSELLLEDARLLAERASQAGVDVALEVWPHMIHVWHVFAGRIPESTAAVDRLGAFLNE